MSISLEWVRNGVNYHPIFKLFLAVFFVIKVSFKYYVVLLVLIHFVLLLFEGMLFLSALYLLEEVNTKFI